MAFTHQAVRNSRYFACLMGNARGFWTSGEFESDLESALGYDTGQLERFAGPPHGMGAAR